MRALVLETINNWSDGGSRAISKHESSEDVALNMDEMLEPIVVLESLLEGLAMKVANSIEDPNSATCTDEILRALSQLAHLETQTLTMYWKIR
ncbi:hypothetical protein PHMEG_00020196 [Phytophthora megakarya]|uniref:Uncharacterized protein n=1 Tax=Phytophthora megakarya TaxID=4795 RepID=A0A225VR89_9STRA|nr:hypothetical protein PHMEG_00020196 [Phytophthora megakarya]